MELLLATEFAARNQKVKAAQINTVHAGVLLDEKQALVILK